MLGGMALSCLGLLLYGSVGQPEQPKPTTPQAAKQVAVTVSEPPAVEAKQQVPPTPDALWAAAVSRLEQADQESAAAIQARLATLDGFFGERKKGALAFAKEMLGSEAKLEVAASVALIPLECLDEWLSGKKSGPNRIDRFATASFQRHVLEPGQVRKAVDRAMSGYEGDVRAIEGRLLVDLRVDLGDGELGAGREAISIPPAVIDQDFQGLINRAVDTACLDSLVSIGGFVASMWASDKLTDGLLGDDAHPAVKFGTDVAIGTQIDKALDGALTQAGYGPEAEIVGRVSRSLDAIQAGIVEGEPSVVERYCLLGVLGDGYPNLAVRTACGEAATVMERAANIGLRRRMLAEQAGRSLLRKAAVHQSIFGPDVPFTPAVHLLDPEKCAPRGQLLQFAERWRTFYGGRNP